MFPFSIHCIPVQWLSSMSSTNVLPAERQTERWHTNSLVLRSSILGASGSDENVECNRASPSTSYSFLDKLGTSDIIQDSSAPVVNYYPTRLTAVQDRTAVHSNITAVRNHFVVHDVLTSNSHSVECQNSSSPAVQ